MNNSILFFVILIAFRCIAQNNGYLAYFPNECQDGWTEYTEGAGRFIISDGMFTSIWSGTWKYELNRKGGAPFIKMQAKNLPKHKHRAKNSFGLVGIEIDNSNKRNIDYNDNMSVSFDMLLTTILATEFTNDSKPHNNVPQYLGLKLCQKLKTFTDLEINEIIAEEINEIQTMVQNYETMEELDQFFLTVYIKDDLNANFLNLQTYDDFEQYQREIYLLTNNIVMDAYITKVDMNDNYYSIEEIKEKYYSIQELSEILNNYIPAVDADRKYNISSIRKDVQSLQGKVFKFDQSQLEEAFKNLDKKLQKNSNKLEQRKEDLNQLNDDFSQKNKTYFKKNEMQEAYILKTDIYKIDFELLQQNDTLSTDILIYSLQQQRITKNLSKLYNELQKKKIEIESLQLQFTNIMINQNEAKNKQQQVQTIKNYISIGTLILVVIQLGFVIFKCYDDYKLQQKTKNSAYEIASMAPSQNQQFFCS